MSALLSKPEWWLLSVPFFLVLFGGLYSDDSSYWLTRMRIKIPFLLLPMAFYLLPGINKKTYEQIHLIFILIITLSSLPVVWGMINDYSSIVDALGHGRPVATPVSHIRYSLFVALAISSSFIISENKHLKTRYQNWLRINGFYLIFFIHFLAVRSGIVALYLVALYFIFRQLYEGRRKRSAIILGTVLLTIPFLAYQLIPSFKERINYMVEDASQYQKMEWNAYSDAERILSLRAGLDISKRYPVFGAGTGDLRGEMQTYFYDHYDKDTFIMPHNQFISILAGSGLVGLLLFVLALVFPVCHCYRTWPGNHLFIAMSIIIFISLMVENTFETSIGVAFYLFFTLIGLNHTKTLV
ncbi:MAG: O-antigen ligase family protein [Saprospiraceae bacterium]|nr:O-antigen ligase family protein [Saprospiraceae bacterium]